VTSIFDPFAIAGKPATSPEVTKQDIVDSNFRRRGQHTESKLELGIWIDEAQDLGPLALGALEYAKIKARVRIKYHEPTPVSPVYRPEDWEKAMDLKFEVKEKWVTIEEAINVYGLSEKEAMAMAEFPLEDYQVVIIDSLSQVRPALRSKKKPEGSPKPQKHYLTMKHHPSGAQHKRSK